MSDDMVKYYRDRAREYEEIYEWRDPHRQEEQDLMETELKKAFTGKTLIDIGCGTGYWTQRVSETAKKIVGIDINETVLDIAKSKTYGCPSEFKIMDGYNITLPKMSFSGVLASFWLSHVLREDMDNWIEHMHKFLEPGATVCIVDNTFIKGTGGNLVTKPNDGNTYKRRTLNDGSQFLIVKNYPTVNELVELFSKYSGGISQKNVFFGECFWWIIYEYRESVS